MFYKEEKTINKEFERIIKQWIDLRKESIEKINCKINNDKEDFTIETKIREIINETENKEIISEKLEELLYIFMDYCYDKNEKYYKAGFGDCLKIVIKTLGEK